MPARTPGAIRKARRRERQKRGVDVVGIELPSNMTDRLKDAGKLTEDDLIDEHERAYTLGFLVTGLLEKFLRDASRSDFQGWDNADYEIEEP